MEHHSAGCNRPLLASCIDYLSCWGRILCSLPKNTTCCPALQQQCHEVKSEICHWVFAIFHQSIDSCHLHKVAATLSPCLSCKCWINRKEITLLSLKTWKSCKSFLQAGFFTPRNNSLIGSLAEEVFSMLLPPLSSSSPPLSSCPLPSHPTPPLQDVRIREPRFNWGRSFLCRAAAAA